MLKQQEQIDLKIKTIYKDSIEEIQKDLFKQDYFLGEGSCKKKIKINRLLKFFIDSNNCFVLEKLKNI